MGEKFGVRGLRGGGGGMEKFGSVFIGGGGRKIFDQFL